MPGSRGPGWAGGRQSPRGVEIEGDPAEETAMRYVIYQLTVNYSARDPGVSIGSMPAAKEHAKHMNGSSAR